MTRRGRTAGFACALVLAPWLGAAFAPSLARAQPSAHGSVHSSVQSAVESATPSKCRDTARSAAERVAESEARIIAPRAPLDVALARIDDRSPAERARAAEALGDLALAAREGADAIDARVRALASAARDDGDAAVRAAAIASLRRLDHAASAAALAALLPELPDAEQTAVAKALAEGLRGGPALESAVRAEQARRALARGRIGEEAFAVLLEALGTALAEAGPDALLPERHAALVAAGTSPADDERRAAYRGLENALARWVWLERADLAQELIERLAAEGHLGAGWHVRRAQLALGDAGDVHAALRAARAVGELAGPGLDDATAAAVVRARVLEAAAALAAGDPSAGAAPLAAARALAAERAGRRLERHASGGRGTRLDVADAAEAQRLVAVVETWELVLELARGRDVLDPAVRERARELHRLLLALHVAAFDWEASNVSGGFDDVLEGEDSPRRLLGLDERHERLPRTAWLAVQRKLGRALALAAPRELPGFLEPDDERLADDPLADPARRELYHALRRAELELLQRRRGDDPANGWLWKRQLELVREQQVADETDPRGLLDYRTPSAAALVLAVDLRGDGDPAASLELALAVQAALADGAGSPLWREWTHARAAMAVGAARTDLGEAELAGAELERAVTRLETVERDLAQRLAELEAGARQPALAADTDAQRRRLLEAQLELTRGFLSDAFVSLAVNANVRAGDPEAAVAFFERAYELRQGDFMVVLLACYRARVGRLDEARALLVDVADAPALHYNMACTHALLGDAERALDYLARTLESSVRSAGARARQREWARDDPDLASLRGHPRFEALTQP